MHVFFALLDAGIYASYKMMLDVAAENSDPSHYAFKKNLAYDLFMPFVQRRAQLLNLRQSVKDAIKLVGVTIPQVESVNLQASADNRRRGTARCQVCSRNRNRKSRNSCSVCNKVICAEHL